MPEKLPDPLAQNVFTSATDQDNLYQQILTGLSNLNPSKLAAHCDLDQCFAQGGHLARVHDSAKFSSIRDSLIKHNHEHKRALRLPLEYAHPRTLAVVQQHYQMSPREMQQWEDQVWTIRATGLNLPMTVTLFDRMPDKLNLFYLGDYMACVDQAIDLGHTIRQAVTRGEGQNILNTIAALKALPDYSPYFSDPEPPRGRRAPLQSGFPGFLSPAAA